MLMHRPLRFPFFVFFIYTKSTIERSWYIYMKNTKVKNKKRIVFLYDMDGFVCEFKFDPQRSHDKGFFLDMNPDEKAVALVKKIHQKYRDNDDVDMSFLSACFDNDYIQGEKSWWLDNNRLKNIDRKFCLVGENKAEAIKPQPNTVYILIDDYTENLRKWEKTPAENGTEYIGVKYMNGINGNNGTWTGRRLDAHDTAEQMFKTITKMVKELQ